MRGFESHQARWVQRHGASLRSEADVALYLRDSRAVAAAIEAEAMVAAMMGNNVDAFAISAPRSIRLYVRAGMKQQARLQARAALDWHGISERTRFVIGEICEASGIELDS